VKSLFYFISFYFALSTLYTLVLSIAGFFSKRKRLSRDITFKKVAIFVPAYKEDAVIISSVQSLLTLKYPKNKFDIIVIADSLQQPTMNKLASLPVTTIEVKFDKSTKAKALNYALNSLTEIYEIAVVSDADNVFDPYFLNHINDAFYDGYKVVQGMRVAKNLDTPYAILDGYSEVVNNHLFRKGANTLGISSALIGSGMAFNYKDFKLTMSEIEAVGGFDKVLQLKLVEQGNYIYYHDQAIVYDEKVSTPEAIKSQRKRWNFSQYKFLKFFFWKGIQMLLRGNFSYFNLSVLGSIFLSRVLNLGVIICISVCITAFSLSSTLLTYGWWALSFLYLLALLLPVKSMPFRVNLFKASLHLPHVFLLIVKSILRMKGADKKFIHTSHTVTDYSPSIHTNQHNE